MQGKAKKIFDLLFSRNSREVTQNMWVHNYSSKELSLIETNVLAKVLNFAPTTKCIPVHKRVASVEDGLRKVIGTQVQLARIDIIGTLKRAEPPASNLI